MASVRLNGDTSGFIEISAPNVAGSTTITLPATSGGNFLVTDSNGDLNVDSGTLFVDASTDRVGVGTTSPAANFHVDAASGDVNGRWSSTGNTVVTHLAGTSDTVALMFGDSGDSDIGQIRYENSDDSMAFVVNNSTRAVLDSSGRLLVGTTAALSSNARAIFAGKISGGNDGQIEIRRAGATPTANTQIGAVIFSDGNASSGHYANMAVFADADSGSGSDLPGRIAFSTTSDGSSSPTERMRIGNLGTTQIASRPNNVTLQLRYAGSPDTSNDIQQVFRDAGINSGVLCCRIRSDGNLQNTNGSYTQISDAKLKENIVDANSQWDDIKGIRIRNWNFKEETGNLTHKQIGPIAQELEDVCPNLVFDTPDKDEEGNDLGTVTKGVNQSVLYMKAVKALQEAMERIETLETANASLEARLTALEGGN